MCSVLCILGIWCSSVRVKVSDILVIDWVILVFVCVMCMLWLNSVLVVKGLIVVLVCVMIFSFGSVVSIVLLKGLMF